MTTKEYQMSMDELLALPVTVPIVTAGRAFGLSRDGTYDLLRRGDFPCRVINVGRANVVPRADLLRVLCVEECTAMPAVADRDSA